MGRTAQILLVSLGLLVAGPSYAGVNCPTSQVAAQNYQAFWLWGGVKLPAQVQNVDTLYLFQGEVVMRRGTGEWVRGGQPLARLKVPKLWLTVRLETLTLSDTLLERLARLPERWQRAGNRVEGLQLDFDAATYRLEEYGQLLKKLRQRLDPRFQLGVTGLLDWAQTGSVTTLNQLPVDEIVIQTYQGRSSVQGYSSYLNALSGLRRPFRIGLVQGGSWQTCWQQRLEQSTFYRGAVVFVVPRKY
ncbi:hypothetical protein TUM12370_32990 [Salmonella enterica subsp. enterica serovar Choleraesuis]|nr:hypothetical protein TUM12370_32990 [Salmonella enterica subsp. enterica serovar Choleraesuis]